MNSPVPQLCATTAFPICCFGNSEVPYNYGCPAGTVCCSTAGSGGCCAPGAARTRGDQAVGNQPLRGVLGGA